jgi:hypothetical protein
MRIPTLLLALVLASVVLALAPPASAGGPSSCVGVVPTAAVCSYDTWTLPGCWLYAFIGGHRTPDFCFAGVGGEGAP